MSEIVKTYQGYTSTKRYGVRCIVNTPRGEYPLHRHDYFEFEVIKSGSIAHELNGARETLSKGAAVALSPGDVHRFSVLSPVEICNLCIYYKDAPGAVEKLLSAVKFPLRGQFFGQDLDTLIDLFEKTEQAVKTGGAFEREIATAYTVLFLANFFSGTQSQVAEGMGYTHVARAMAFIAANFTSDISLEDVADSVYLTPGYFSKLFMRISGKSFIRYLTEQRVEHAKLLLATTDQSVTEVAFASGFGSFSAFSRAFRACCEMTPREFRKQERSS